MHLIKQKHRCNTCPRKKLNPPLDDSLHELFDECVVRFAGDALLTQPDVERVFEQRLVVRADVERDWQTLAGLHACARRVETQFTCRGDQLYM